MTASPIGFVGFGEAAFHLAVGLKGAGAGDILAYDIHASTPGRGETIHSRAAASGTRLCDSPQSLCESSEILFSTVTADNALEAVRHAAPFLESRHIFADLNSVSPEVKKQVGATVSGRGAAFVEVAVMGPVPRSGHRVPMLLGGRDASRFVEHFAPYGMSMEIVSDAIGSASAVKLCRSIIVKGLEALMLECAMASSEYDAGDRVFESLEQSFPGLDWKRLAGYMISRVAVHGERRAREMEEAATMLASIGIEPIMTEAAVRRQDWCAKLDLREAFAGGVPEDDYHAIVEAIRVLKRG